jgi:hypothetical protein
MNFIDLEIWRSYVLIFLLKSLVHSAVMKAKPSSIYISRVQRIDI